MKSTQRLRLALGKTELETLIEVFGYTLDTWKDPDEEPSAYDRDLFRRIERLREHIMRERVRQGL